VYCSSDGSWCGPLPVSDQVAIDWRTSSPTPRPVTLTAADVLASVAAASCQPMAVLIGPRWARGSSRARLVAVHLMRTQADLNGREIGLAFGRTRQWASLSLHAADDALEHDTEAQALCRRARHLLRANLRTRAWRARRRIDRTPQFLAGLRDARLAACMTEAQLAAICGVRRETLSRLEGLRRRARASVARTIAAALSVSLDVLLGADHAALTSVDTQVARPGGTTPQPESRVCTDCGLIKTWAEFLPIAGTPYVYGRCRKCRAQRAREQYWANAQLREAKRPRGKAKRNTSQEHSRRSAA
jgi:transcriptional regulator with XRE-family HTH domain